MQRIKNMFSGGTGIVMTLVVFLPLIQHVIWCIGKADETGSAIALLIAGLVFFPVGWVHGMAVIFGFGGWV